MSCYYTFRCYLCDKTAPLLTRNTALPLQNFEASNFTSANKGSFLIRDCDESTYEEMLDFVGRHKLHTLNGNRALGIVNDEGAPVDP